MAPRDIEIQTFRIVKHLLEDEEKTSFRGYVVPDGGLECQNTLDSEDDNFDPVIIADMLRELGDTYDVSVIQPLIKKLKEASPNTMSSVFTTCVESLSHSGSAELAPERQLLKAAVALGLYVKRVSPDLISILEGTMASFLNTRLGGWIQQQGGWEEAASGDDS